MRNYTFCLMIGVLSATSGSAVGDIIDFESFPLGTVVTTQYPSVTFSTSEGQENRIAFDFDFGTGQYLITAEIGGEVNGVNSTVLDFTMPVSDLTFLALGDNSAGDHAMVDVYVDDEFLVALPITVDGIFDTPDFVDLSGFSGITKIILWDITDPGGLAWDRFSFTVIPTPSALVVFGFGLISHRRRR